MRTRGCVHSLSSLGSGSAKAAAALLDGPRVATVPGIVFGPEGEGHLRFSFSVAEETIAGGAQALKEPTGSVVGSR